MLVDFHGLSFETPRVTFYLWTPWRASSLEHRMFDAVCALPKVQTESGEDDRRVHIGDQKTWRGSLQALDRVLKGWQEEAPQGGESRSWRWLMEGDSDRDGYDHTGEVTSLWIFLRAVIERGGPEHPEKDEIDLEGFSLRIWPQG